MRTLRILTGNAHPALAGAIVRSLRTKLCEAEVGRFPDGETKVRILEDVRGTDVFVIQPVCPPQNENLMELLILIDAVKRSSAERITAVMPYYGYARQDRKHEGRVPITAKLVANLLEAAGADRVLTMDLHATQIQGFFDIPMDHLFALPIFEEYLKATDHSDIVVMAPDPGSIKMAQAYARRLGGGLALMEKRRVSDTEVAVGNVVGEIEGKDVIVVDDMITTGGSMAQAVRGAREKGARRVVAVATHALLLDRAVERLIEAKPDEVVVTDTIPPRPSTSSGRGPEQTVEGPREMAAGGNADTHGLDLKVLSVAPMLGEAIRRIHLNESVSSLF